MRRSAQLMLSVLLLFASVWAAAPPGVSTREAPFKHGKNAIQGLIAWNDEVKGKRPGVLIVHGGWGYTDNVRAQARRIAESGYVGYAFDMAGHGAVATHLEHSPSGGPLEKNLAMMATRFHLAVEQLKQDPHVDPGRISAIGYCWGGMVVLNMARSGANLDAVVAIAPVLETTIPAQKNQVVPRILALLGDQDPVAPREKIEAFRKEMTDAGARFEVILYPGVKHAFTQPYADKAGRPGLAYDADADRKSWASLLKLLKEIYG